MKLSISAAPSAKQLFARACNNFDYEIADDGMSATYDNTLNTAEDIYISLALQKGGKVKVTFQSDSVNSNPYFKILLEVLTSIDKIPNPRERWISQLYKTYRLATEGQTHLNALLESAKKRF